MAITVYKISSYPSKYYGYHINKDDKSEISLYISRIWEYAKKFSDNEEDAFGYFLNQFNFTLILERICLEVRFQKLRVKKRCNPCKMVKYAKEMMEVVKIN